MLTNLKIPFRFSFLWLTFVSKWSSPHFFSSLFPFLSWSVACLLSSNSFSFGMWIVVFLKLQIFKNAILIFHPWVVNYCITTPLFKHFRLKTFVRCSSVFWLLGLWERNEGNIISSKVTYLIVLLDPVRIFS